MQPLTQDVAQPWKSAVFSQFLREGIWRGPDGKTYMGYSMVTEQYNYVEWHPWDKETKTAGKLVAKELYDHHEDPEENRNIVDEVDKELLQRLAKQLRSGWQAARP